MTNNESLVLPDESDIRATLNNVIERDQYVKQMSILIVSLIKAGSAMPFKRWCTLFHHKEMLTLD